MILFTKECFIQLKLLINLHVNVNASGPFDPSGTRSDVWQVYIQGIVPDGGPVHAEVFQQYITAESKEDAYRIYNELMHQVIQSGEIHALTTEQLDKILKEP